MKYDVTMTLVDHRGRKLPINDKDVDPQGNAIKGSKLRDVLELVCIAPNETIKGAEDKLKVYRVLQRISKAERFVELEAAEVELLKKMIATNYPAALYGVLYDVLENPVSDEQPPGDPAEAPAGARRTVGRGKS